MGIKDLFSFKPKTIKEEIVANLSIQDAQCLIWDLQRAIEEAKDHQLKWPVRIPKGDKLIVVCPKLEE